MADATVRMGYNDAELQAGLARSQGHVAKFVSATQGRFATVGGALKSGLSSGLGFLGIGAGLAGIKSIMDEFDRMKDLGEQLNQTPEAIQKIGIMAQQSGSDVETVARALNRINKELATPQGRSVFKELGMDAARFKGQAADQQMIELAEAFQKAEREGRGLKETYDLIGKSAADLLPLLRANTSELREMAGRPVVTDEQVRMIGRFNDGLDEMIRMTKVGAVMLGDELAMAFREVGEALSDLGEGDEIGAGMDRVLSGNGMEMGDDAAEAARMAREKRRAERQREIDAARTELQKQQQQTMEESASTADKLFEKQLELSRLDDEIRGAKTGGDEALVLQLLAKREALMRTIGQLVKENLREIDAQVSKERDLRDLEVELQALRLRSQGRGKEADALVKELNVRKEAERLMKDHNMSEKDAMRMARERADLEEKIEQGRERKKDGKIRGYSQEQRESSRFNNPFRGLDEHSRMQRGGSGRLLDDHLKTPGLERHRNLQLRNEDRARIIPVGQGLGKPGAKDAGKDEATRKLDAIEQNTRKMVEALAEG